MHCSVSERNKVTLTVAFFSSLTHVTKAAYLPANMIDLLKVGALVLIPLIVVQVTHDLRKPDLRKNLNLRKIVATTDFLVHKLFDLRKIF